MEWG